MKYFFILGRNYTLSIQEILSVMDEQGVVYEHVNAEPEYLILDIHDSFDYTFFQKRLGGTIKIGRIIEENKTLHDLIGHPFGFLPSLCHAGNKKVFFGISYYGKANRHFTEKGLYKLASEIKAVLKEDGYGSRYVTSKDIELSSVVISKNNILEKGAEIVLLPASTKKAWVGTTLCVQDYEKYNHFDYDRPASDSKSGMLPPKLSQMMLNMTGTAEGILYDPFCGSGTVLMMAGLLGYKKIYGSDISEKAIEDTKINMQWFQGEFGIDGLKMKIFEHDITQKVPGIESGSIQSIVAEPYLGRPQTGDEPEEDIIKQKKQLEQLYIKAFEQFKALLMPEGRIVIVMPLFKHNHVIDILTEVKKLGFYVQTPYHTCLKYEQRGSLVYSRPGQHVKREIFIFTKKET